VPFPTPEFDLIARYFSPPVRDAVLGGGDDCALLSVRPGHELAVSTDTLVSGVHFFADTNPHHLGYKALAVNLSDLAAMGAKPRWFVLAITLPKIDHAWLKDYSEGLLALALEAEIELVGGDTTRGPLAMTLTVMGEIPRGQALRRDGAKVGDDIWVSGSLGDAALALACLQGKVQVAEPQRGAAVARLERPTARVALGIHLRGLAHSAIDVSDGLLADLGHICLRSGVGAEVLADKIPFAPAVAFIADEMAKLEYALAGGDDYELCFTAAPSRQDSIAALSAQLNLPLTRIGTMVAGDCVSVVGDDGTAISLVRPGFDHFAAP
jgi:thiamine-monophosphate kinase